MGEVIGLKGCVFQARSFVLSYRKQSADPAAPDRSKLPAGSERMVIRMSIYAAGAAQAKICAYYYLSLSEYQMQPHAHAGCEIMYVLRGRCTVGVRDKTLALRPGEMIFIDAGVPHRLLVARGSPCTIANLEFTCGAAPGGADLAALRRHLQAFDLFLARPAEYRVLADVSNMSHALRDLINELEFEDGSPDKEYELHVLFTRVLIELAKCALHGETAAGLPHVRRAQTYIREHYTADLRVRQVADAVSLNPAYLEKLFRQSLHCGVMAYVGRMRLQKAAFLLKNSDESVTQVAFDVGFNSRQHFSLAFRKRYRLTPREFRERATLGPAAETEGFMHTGTFK